MLASPKLVSLLLHSLADQEIRWFRVSGETALARRGRGELPGKKRETRFHPKSVTEFQWKNEFLLVRSFVTVKFLLGGPELYCFRVSGEAARLKTRN